MRQPIILPDLGAVAAVASVWFAEPGDVVYQGDRLLEIVVRGATFDITAPVTGRLSERHAYPRDPLTTGQVLGIVDVFEDE